MNKGIFLLLNGLIFGGRYDTATQIAAGIMPTPRLLAAEMEEVARELRLSLYSRSNGEGIEVRDLMHSCAKFLAVTAPLVRDGKAPWLYPSTNSKAAPTAA